METHPSHRPVITLTSDFGTAEPYVGVMKGVILSRCPQVTLVDLTHGVSPQDVAAGAYLLQTGYGWFAPGTIHLAVVDPGVGADRRAIAAEAGGHRFVAPDNGLLSLILDEAESVRVVQVQAGELFCKPVSSTFHGRDVFAPVAAALARGFELSELGPTIDDWVRLELPSVEQREDGSLSGHVIHIDRFGNLVTDLRGERLPMLAAVEIAGRKIERLGRSYAQAEPGELLAVIGSTGRLEISVNRGSAAARLGAKVGTPVNVLRGMEKSL